MGNGSIDLETLIDPAYSIEDPSSAFEAFLNSETVKPVFTSVEH